MSAIASVGRLRSPAAANRLIRVVTLGALAIVPLVGPGYPESVATRILIFGLFAVSLDILWGYTGMFSLGHAAFLGVGGYTVALLGVRFGIDSFWVAAPLGVALAIIVGAVFGIIALRMAGAYFLLVTLALGELLVAVATRWPFFSTQSGTEGVFGVLRPSLGLPVEVVDNSAFYWFVLAIVVVSFTFVRYFIRTPVGNALQGIRQNESRMEALGYHTWAYRYLAFVVAAAIAGLAGVLLAYHNGFVVPSMLGLDTSTLVLLMVLIGGPGTLYGPVVGAGLIILLEVVASTFQPERWPLILGASYVAAVIFARGGIVPRLTPAFMRLKQRLTA